MPQQINIPNNDNQSRSSRNNGDRFILGQGVFTTVDGAPVLALNNNQVTFTNQGSANTTGDTATVELNGTRGVVRNNDSGEISAEHTGVEVLGARSLIINRGLIAGGVNGVDFVNGGQSSGTLRNTGTITSDSRAVNIGGRNVDVINQGDILGTGDQRNGTIYADATAEDIRISNLSGGLIDAGDGNQGAGIALQLGNTENEVVNVVLRNIGTIQGRGQGDPSSGLAGDGIRAYSGVYGGGTTYRGSIINRGDILSDSTQGPTSAIRIADGLSFQGRILNASNALIDGAQNGLYFGDAAHAVTVTNQGIIQSGSRAINIDGSGITVNNDGTILGTGDQRNGTIYSDATADNYVINNGAKGVVDAGVDNNGAGISLQTGDVSGDTVTASVTNEGLIYGRGNADGNQSGDGIRIFSGVDDASTTFIGDIDNSGSILATDAGVEIVDVVLDGEITNSGIITGARASIDATAAVGPVVVNNSGTLNGDVLLGSGDDTYDGSQGTVNGSVLGGEGADELIGGSGADRLVGGLGDDTLTGNGGADTFVFAPTDLGADVITDFQDGSDLLDVSAFVAAGAIDLNSLNIQQVGNDTLITLAQNNTVLLETIQVAQISVADLVF